MANRVLCLRPEADFLKAGVTPPATLAIKYSSPTEPGLIGLVREADALVIPAVGPRLGGELFEGAALRLVQVTGAGVDRLDEAAMRRLGIPVANVPGASNDAVAEYVIAAALVLVRQLAWSNEEIRCGRYAEARTRLLAETPFGLGGLTVGVIGLGTIGEAVAAAVARFGARVAYFDPKPRDPEAAARAGFTALPLNELLETSDVVTLHVPLVADTVGLIGAPEIGRMKQSAILINAARGGIVNEAALAKALEEGRIGGAAIDVYEREPPGADNALLKVGGAAASRLLLTPHIAGITRQSWAALFAGAWENVERVLLQGLTPRHQAF